MNARIVAALTALVLIMAAAGASAAPFFAGFNLEDFDFDVTSYDPGTGAGISGDAVASGTSNGVAWDIGPTNLWSGRTTTDGSFNFSVLPIATDNLHTSIDFTVTFGQTIDALIVALDNDNTTDSIDFGVAPTLTQGLNVTGTSVKLATAAGGGLALFENLNSMTVMHTNTDAADGFDFAFHVRSTAVPAPGAAVLLGLGLLLGGVARRR